MDHVVWRLDHMEELKYVKEGCDNEKEVIMAELWDEGKGLSLQPDDK